MADKAIVFNDTTDAGTIRGALSRIGGSAAAKLMGERARKAALKANKEKKNRNREDIDWYTKNRED